MSQVDWASVEKFQIDQPSGLQQALDHLYVSQLCPPQRTRNEFIKFAQTLQMIMLYLEYCNVTLITTNAQLDKDLNNLQAKIQKKESALLESKRRIEKQRLARKALKDEIAQLKKQKRQISFGCIYCPKLEFIDSVLLSNHMKIHRKDQDLTPQIMNINQNLVQQLTILQQMKQAMKEQKFIEQDLEFGRQAAIENHCRMMDENQYKRLELAYEKHLEKMGQLREQVPTENIPVQSEETEQQKLENMRTKLHDKAQERIKDFTREKKLNRLSVQSYLSAKSRKTDHGAESQAASSSNLGLSKQSQQGQLLLSKPNQSNASGSVKASQSPKRQSIAIDTPSALRKMVSLDNQITLNYEGALSKFYTNYNGAQNKSFQSISNSDDIEFLEKLDIYMKEYDNFNRESAQVLLNRTRELINPAHNRGDQKSEAMNWLQARLKQMLLQHEENLPSIQSEDDIEEFEEGVNKLEAKNEETLRQMPNEELELYLKELQSQTADFVSRGLQADHKKSVLEQSQVKAITDTPSEGSDEESEKDEVDEGLDPASTQRENLDGFPFAIAKHEGQRLQTLGSQGYQISQFNIDY